MKGLTKEEFLQSIKEMSEAELTLIYNLHEDLVSLAKQKQDEMNPSQFIYGLVGFGYHILLNHFKDPNKAAEKLKEFIDDVNGTLKNAAMEHFTRD